MSNDVSNDADVPLTEITIQPDGRVYVQGLSREVLEVLVTLQPDDPHVAGLLAHVTHLESKVDGKKS